jgi:hypothetical protein
MKSKEEIEQLALEYSNIGKEAGLTHKEYTLENLGFIKGYTQCQEDMLHDQKLTRFEVIDENGRAYTEYSCKVELSYQDDGRTLKVFIKQLNKQDYENEKYKY